MDVEIPQVPLLLLALPYSRAGLDVGLTVPGTGPFSFSVGIVLQHGMCFFPL